MAYERLFGFQRSFGVVGQPDAVGNAEHVGVDSHSRLVENDGKHDIGRFPSYAGNFHQFVEIGRYFAAVFLHEHAGGSDKRFRLVVGKRNAFDVFEDDFRSGACHGFRGRVVVEQWRGYDVDALVGALCRQDDCHKQLERIFVVQFRFSHRHVCREPFDNALISFLCCHLCRNNKEKIHGVLRGIFSILML